MDEIREQVYYQNRINNIEYEIIKNLYNRKELFKKRELLKEQRKICAYTGKTLDQLYNIRTPEIEKTISILTGKTLEELYIKPKTYSDKKTRIKDLLKKETNDLIIEILKNLMPFESSLALEGTELITNIELYFINNTNQEIQDFKEEELINSRIDKLDIFQIYKSDDKYLLVGYFNDDHIICEFNNILELRDAINCRYIDFNNEELLKEIEELTIKEMLKEPSEKLSELL